MARRIVLVTLILVLLSPLVSAVEDDCIYYFHGAGCDECKQTNAHIEQLELKYPELRIQKFEVYHSRENFQKLQEFLQGGVVPLESQGVPVVFMPGSFFVGDTIIDLLEKRIKDNEDSNCPVPNAASFGVIGRKNPKNVIETLTFFSVTWSALRDSFSAGSIALMLILLVILFYINDGEEMLKRGMTFIGGVYLAFFFYGYGFFSSFAGSGIGRFFYKIVGLLAVIFALLNIKGFFKTWEVWVRSVSETTKQVIKRFLNKISSYGGMLILGFLVSFFAFSEVSNTFLSIRTLVADEASRSFVWPLLLYYTFIFIFHLLAAVLLLFFIRQSMKAVAHTKSKGSDHKLELWKKHNHKIINFFISLLMMILGLIILFV